MSSAKAGGPPPPPPPNVPLPPSSDISKSSGSSPMPSEAFVISQYPNNPGLFESLHNKIRDTLPQTFEGAKLVFNKAMSSHFQLTHTLSMGNVQPAGYKFGATFVGDTKRSESELFPVILGEIEPSGDMNAQVIHQFGRHLRTKCVAQIQQGAIAGWSATGEWRDAQTSSAISSGNVDPFSGTGSIAFETMRNITSRLTLGSQLSYHCSPFVPGGSMAMWAIGGRYTLDKTTVSMTASPYDRSAHLSFHRKVTDALQIATEFQLDARQRLAVGLIGYQYELTRANTTFRAQIDSTLCCEALMEKKLAPLPFTLTLSAQAIHRKPAYRLGIGFTVG